MSQAVGSGNEQLPPSAKNKKRFSLPNDTALHDTGNYKLLNGVRATSL